MEILIQVEVEVRSKSGFSGKFGFSVFVIAALVPYRITAIEVRADIVWNIGNDKLCLLNWLALPILH